MKVGQSGRQNLLLTVLMAASAGSLLPLVGHAQQRDDLRENGPYDQRYFARAKGVASQPLPSELRKQPDITFQNDATGNTNELIILLDYSQSAQLRGLLGAEGKTDATNTPTGRLCCTNLIQPEIPPTPDAATPQQAPPLLWGTQVA